MKNNAKSLFTDTEIETGFTILKLINRASETASFNKEVSDNYIQLFLCTAGSGKLVYNNGAYKIDITANNSLILYNPMQNLPVHVELEKDTKILVALITIEKFHSFFSEFATYITFLSDENRNKKYYSGKPLSPREQVVLNDIFDNNMHRSLEKLYTKAKIYELLSLYFNISEDADTEKCPFLNDEKNVLKIKQAKEIIIAQMAEPPTLAVLAKEIGLSLSKLKEGFKQLYGDTVFNFLFDYKMDYARKMLSSKKYNVSEVSELVGYSTSSHFIAAFKKKFGTTPKKYLGKI